MRYAVGESYEFLHGLTQLPGSLSDCPFQQVFLELSRGDVARYFKESPQFPIGIKQGPHGSADEKPLSVLSQMPALVAGAPVLPRPPQFFLRFTFRLVLWGEQNTGVLAHDFGFCISKE